MEQQAEKLKDAIIEALENSKAQDIQTLDVRGLTDITDYMVITNGTSSRHTAALAKNLVDDLKKQGYRPLSEEGNATDSDWYLVDYGDVVTHIMERGAREFYELEKFWGEDMQHLVQAAREK